MTDRILVWPSKRFYWATLDMAHVPGGRPNREQRLFELERWVPQPVDELHAVFVRGEGTAWVAAALPLDELGDVPHEARSLVPEDVPSFIPNRVDARQFEFLTDALLPHAATRWRSGSAALAGAAALLAIALLALGTHRRDRAGADYAASVDAAIAAAVAKAVPAAGASSLPADLRLEAELRKLRRTHQGPSGDAGLAAPELLGLLLRSWPEKAELQVEAVVSSGSAITITGTAPTAEAVQRVARQLGSDAPLELQAPTVRAHDGLFRFEMRLDNPEATR